MKEYTAADRSIMTSENTTAPIGEYLLPLIARHPLFAGLQKEEILNALFFLRARVTNYRKGELLHPLGSSLSDFGLLLSGNVHVCTDDIEGNKTIMAEVRPGNTFGEALSFLRADSSEIYILCSKPGEVLWLCPEGLMREDSSPLCAKLNRRFAEMLARRTLEMNARIQILTKLRLREKLVAYFTEEARRQGGNLLRISLSREDLAAFMGTNRSALSRELSCMKAQGLIDYHKNTVRLLFGSSSL